MSLNGDPSMGSLPSLLSGIASTRNTPEMEEIMREQAKIESLLSQIDLEIFKAEEEYFEKTPHGNIVRGWEGVLDNKPPPKRRYEGRERVFSWSSYTFWSKNIDTGLSGGGGMMGGVPNESTQDLLLLDDASLGGGGGVVGGGLGLVPPLPSHIKRNRSLSSMDPKLLAMKQRQARKRKRRESEENLAGMEGGGGGDEEEV